LQIKVLKECYKERYSKLFSHNMDHVKLRGSFDKFGKKATHFLKHIFLEKSTLFLNIVSIEVYTLGPTSFQFFNTVGKVGCLEPCKILVDGDDLIRREFLSTEPDF